MDGLTQDERALAWAASWHPSFAGIAIVNPDFSFRAVNPQFCEILGVSPGELIGSKFTDITPQPIRALDIKNAELVKGKIITSYLLPKVYEFQNGKKVNVVLLVSGVYQENSLLFYVSRILKTEMDSENITTPLSATPKPIKFFTLIRECWHIILAVLSAVAVVAATIIDKLHLLPQ